MSTTWALIVGTALITFAIKAAGPVVLGGRRLPTWFSGVVTLLAPALLSALVVTHALADDKHLTIGPQTAGVVAGGMLAWRTGSMVWCVVGAAVVTAALRAVT